MSGERGAESALAGLLCFGLRVCTGVSLPGTPRKQFGGDGAAIERESPLPSTAETSYHGRELKRALGVMQQFSDLHP